MTFIVEYIWLDNNKQLRSKARTIDISSDNWSQNIIDVSNIPKWTYDGSSTGQATGHDSEITLIPRAVFDDPFRGEQNKFVVCDTYDSMGNPTESNTRYLANNIFNNPRCKEQEPWFGLEQEYFLMNTDTNKPLGWPKNGVPEAQGKYYCGVGQGKVFGRDIVNKHYEYCLTSGITISGINAEVAPGQWEFQIGPVCGISAGDHMLVARYILERITEDSYETSVNYDPKPITGDWNGSGCHTNFSTKNMREGTSNRTGLIWINEGIDKLSHKHKEHMEVYGSGNERRMTGEYETSSYNTFSSSVAGRGCSIRIPRHVNEEKKGYLEDRRPASNCDPYLVTSKICETVCL
jgi:glutamine synthetase